MITYELHETHVQFYNQALSDLSETPFLSKTHIRFNMALSNENAGDLTKAEEEYKDILAEVFFSSYSFSILIPRPYATVCFPSIAGLGFIVIFIAAC